MIDFHEILDRMNQNQRINFDNVFQRMARRWQQDGVKPRILLHSCCGPCSTAVLDRLTRVADVTVYYSIPISIRKRNTGGGNSSRNSSSRPIMKKRGTPSSSWQLRMNRIRISKLSRAWKTNPKAAPAAASASSSA